MPEAVLPPDPIRLQMQLHGRAARARWRADPVTALVLALVWCAVLAAGAGLGWPLLRSHAAVLHAGLAAQLATCILLAFAMSLVDTERALLRAERRWRSGWMAGLPGLQAAVPRQLTLLALRRAVLQSAAALLVPPLIASADAVPATQWPAGWWLVVAAPWMAALLARALASRRRASPARGLRELPAATWILAGLPVAARWQWAAWARAQRGRAAAWMLLPLLLAVPAGMSGAATLSALLGAFAIGVLLTLWSTALLQLPRAAALLRATPCSALRFLRDQLLLPAVLLAVVTGGLAVLLASAAGWIAAALVLIPLSAALLHAGVVCAERHHPRRIGPLLALQLALPLALLQAVPPLVLPLVLLQVLVLARRALRQ